MVYAPAEALPQFATEAGQIQSRRPGVVSTLGLATQNPDVMLGVVHNSDVVRVNWAHYHQKPELALGLISLAYSAAAERGKSIKLLCDLQGEKLRTGFLGDGVFIEPNKEVSFLFQGHEDFGRHPGVIPVQADFSHQVFAGNPMSMADGKYKFEITSSEPGGIVTAKLQNPKGVKLVSNKGMNFPLTRFPIRLLPHDLADMEFMAENGIRPDYLGYSFTQAAETVDLYNSAATEYGILKKNIVKPENLAAMEEIEEIVVAADVIMIPRGDLGPELGQLLVPAAQFIITGLCNMYEKEMVTATGMKESMMHSNIATRAEYTDASVAVMLGSSIMASEEVAMNYDFAVDVSRTLREEVDFYTGKSIFLEAALTGKPESIDACLRMMGYRK